MPRATRHRASRMGRVDPLVVGDRDDVEPGTVLRVIEDLRDARDAVRGESVDVQIGAAHQESPWMSSQIGKKSVHHCSGASADRRARRRATSAGMNAFMRSFGCAVCGGVDALDARAVVGRRRAAWRRPRLACRSRRRARPGQRASGPARRTGRHARPLPLNGAIGDERHRLVIGQRLADLRRGALERHDLHARCRRGRARSRTECPDRRRSPWAR